MERNDRLVRAMRLAIGRAKRRNSETVTLDDVLVGLLQSMARFGIVFLGRLSIDLEALGDSDTDEADAIGPKVSYSPEAAALFDRAAAVARRERSPHIAPIHMLAAFANEDSGLMGRLKETYGIDACDWREALARTASVDRTCRDGESSDRAATVKELLSPDDAAEFLSVHTQTVRGYIRSGKLPAHRLAGERVVRIRREDLLELLEPYDPE